MDDIIMKNEMIVVKVKKMEKITNVVVVVIVENKKESFFIDLLLYIFIYVA
jgi:hypothetical protein